eukprot:SAG31_NODE_1092_length_9957_cov_10.569284_4_plen_123_part_00
MLQQESGAFIQTQRDSEASPGSTERELYLAGTAEQVELAKDAIAAIVAQCPEQQQSLNRGAPSETHSGAPLSTPMSMELSAGMNLQPIQTMSLTDGLELTAVSIPDQSQGQGVPASKRVRLN